MQVSEVPIVATLGRDAGSEKLVQEHGWIKQKHTFTFLLKTKLFIYCIQNANKYVDLR